MMNKTTKTDLEHKVDYIAQELRQIFDGLYEELNEDGEEMSFYDYFIDALDIEYMIGADMNFRGCKIMVACGGPNIWVDTTRGEVFGAWGTERATAWIPSEICEEIDSVFEDLYQCSR